MRVLSREDGINVIIAAVTRHLPYLTDKSTKEEMTKIKIVEERFNIDTKEKVENAKLQG